MNELKLISVNARGGLNGKLPYFQNIIQTYKPDFLLLQETNIRDHYTAQTFTHNLGLNKGIFSLAQFCNGTAILQTSNRWTITQHTSDNTSGRVTTAVITNNATTHTLINIYAPSLASKRPTFYEQLNNTLSTVSNNVILAGDFNITLDDKDIKGKDIGPQRKGRPELQIIVNTHNLKDSYREIHKIDTDITHKNLAIDRAARIDRIYVNNTQIVTQCSHLDSTLQFTNHKAVFTTINNSIPNNKKRSPHWKFNNSLLEDQGFIQSIKNTISLYTNPIPKENICKSWDKLKSSLKIVSIVKAKQINKRRRDREKEINKLIEHAQINGTHDDPLILDLQTELDDIRLHRLRGAQIRSRYKTTHEERPTPDFLYLEQNIQKNRTINEID